VLLLVLQVVQYWAEKGLSGFTVFKYRLRRMEGQPILTTNQVFMFPFLFKDIFTFLTDCCSLEKSLAWRYQYGYYFLYSELSESKAAV
jgi:hypothetical protein